MNMLLNGEITREKNWRAKKTPVCYFPLREPVHRLLGIKPRNININMAVLADSLANTYNRQKGDLESKTANEFTPLH